MLTNGYNLCMQRITGGIFNDLLLMYLIALIFSNAKSVLPFGIPILKIALYF